MNGYSFTLEEKLFDCSMMSELVPTALCYCTRERAFDSTL